MRAECSSETLLLPTPQQDATTQTAIMRSQHTAHYVENITADLSNAAKGHLIGISKTLRKKEDADGDGDRETDSLAHVLTMTNTEKQRGKKGGKVREDFQANSHCVNAHSTM